MYGRYGRHRTALVANVISYRPRSALRDMAAALGHSPGQRDTWSRRVEHTDTDLQHLSDWHGRSAALHDIPADDEVYAMLRAADTVGVFQVESRQMATLPRLAPRRFYDLVVAIGLIRPGPVAGGSVRTYLRRAAGLEAVSYPHPAMRHALDKTHGVILWQEQVLKVAMDVAGLSAGEADQLRRAMGSKRSTQRMEALRDRLFTGMAEHRIDPDTAGNIYTALAAFAGYGFPESHAISFALIAWAHAWCKRWYPASFYAGLLAAQPMGFYSPQSLVADARRHGVRVQRPDINASAVPWPRSPPPRPARSRPRHPARLRKPGAGRDHRCVSACPRCAPSAPPWPNRSPPNATRAARTAAKRTWRAGSGSPRRRWRRWPPPAYSPRWASSAAWHSGPRDPPHANAPTRSPAPRSYPQHPSCPA